MIVGSGTALIDVVQGSHKINLPLFFAANTNVNVASGATLRISNPTTLSGGVTVNKNGGGTLIVQSTLNASSPATLKLNGGVTSLDAANSNPNISINVDPATINVGANQTLGSLTMTAGGNVVNVGRDSSVDAGSGKPVQNVLCSTGAFQHVVGTTEVSISTAKASVLTAR